MNNFFTWFFTLLTALSTICLKDYLDNKKSNKLTIKQKAVAAYILIDSLRDCLIPKMVICKNLLEDPFFDWVTTNNQYPDNASDNLMKLEVLIIENFYDLNHEFLIFRKIITGHLSFLLKVMTSEKSSSSTILKEDFENAKSEFDIAILQARINLEKLLVENYINPKRHANLFDLIDKTKKWIRKFFAKS